MEVPTSSSSCPEYKEYAKVFHGPASSGSLKLPFQRPIEACRTFTSKVIDQAVDFVASKIANADLARLFTNTFPNTLDTTVSQTACLTNQTDNCHPLSFVITGDINAMWLRDSANQMMPYLNYIPQDYSLKRLFLGTIYLQAHFISIDPYANAFHPGQNMQQWSIMQTPNPSKHHGFSPGGIPEVADYKWEIDSLASFFSLSFQYWQTTQDRSFIDSPIWMNAVETSINLLLNEQHGTFDPKTGDVLPVNERYSQTTRQPADTQFLEGRGQPIKQTGMIRTLFRPSDDACVFPFFVPGNAMISVELDHLSQLIRDKNATLANQASQLSKDIREAIFKYGVVDLPDHGKVFAYEVDGYGAQLIMDDANVPSLLSLPLLGFVPVDDPIYQNTRRLVLSKGNPYYYEGPSMSGIGSPHVPLNYAWPMSQIVRIMTSKDDTEIKETLDLLLRTTAGTGLIHESIYILGNPTEKVPYTRSWFGWANSLFGQAIIQLVKEKPHLLA
ncbi:meiotically up-regulated gene 157 protein [Halteromyces radiatus]|uniref:meiotically up-regulated gene 157 protein n=1 Tax=Halteromyces radiatus TaxID=101107 RepID=UPI00221F7128|nr:meiotically up-regulated gene 157 protein [Halteromyces radiatus]KAI8099011.1 meiotically up-regulated gene 157 protein [Halteromyces radiatus]